MKRYVTIASALCRLRRHNGAWTVVGTTAETARDALAGYIEGGRHMQTGWYGRWPFRAKPGWPIIRSGSAQKFWYGRQQEQGEWAGGAR